jgi:hypothetical protein
VTKRFLDVGMASLQLRSNAIEDQGKLMEDQRLEDWARKNVVLVLLLKGHAF